MNDRFHNPHKRQTKLQRPTEQTAELTIHNSNILAADGPLSGGGRRGRGWAHTPPPLQHRGAHADFWGPRWQSQSQWQKSREFAVLRFSGFFFACLLWHCASLFSCIASLVGVKRESPAFAKGSRTIAIFFCAPKIRRIHYIDFLSIFT